jgi:hypothetical protein
MKAVAIMTPDPKNLAKVKARVGMCKIRTFLETKGNRAPIDND